MAKKYPQIPVKSDKTKVTSTVKPIKPVKTTLFDKINISSKVTPTTKTLRKIGVEPMGQIPQIPRLKVTKQTIKRKK